jgi:hypothetical protein
MAVTAWAPGQPLPLEEQFLIGTDGQQLIGDDGEELYGEIQ